MQARLILVGTGKPITMPSDQHHYEGGRRILFPKPGEKFHYGTYATDPARDVIGDQRFGLLVLDDWHYPTKAVMLDDDTPPPTITNIQKAEELTLDLETRFGNYGLLRIAGEYPTQQELTRATTARQRFAMALVAQDNVNVQRAKVGQGGNPFNSEAAIAFAQEFGLLLASDLPEQPNTPLEDRRVTCPNCAEPVKLAARICPHCHLETGFHTAQPAPAAAGKEEGSDEETVVPVGAGSPGAGDESSGRPGLPPVRRGQRNRGRHDRTGTGTD